MRSRFLLTVTAIALAACAAPPEGAWVLTSFTHPEADTGAVALPRPVTLAIDGDTVDGASGCNSYQGAVTVEDGRLRFTSVAVTDMYCADQAVMAAEARFLEALVAHDWDHTVGGGLRLVAADDDRIVLEFSGE